MNIHLSAATIEIAKLLEVVLPKLTADWWSRLVIDKLSFQQQRMVQERRVENLRQFDLAALLRIIDQNWFEISQAQNWPREARNWVKELQVVRNKWAHQGSTMIPKTEIYRDLDTLGRLLELIGATHLTIEAINADKLDCLATMSPTRQIAKESVVEMAVQTTLFEKGELVVLRADPSIVLPILEILPNATECRYSVFEGGTIAQYFESQLQKHVKANTRDHGITANELRAHLTVRHILSPSTANLFSLRSGRVQFVPYQYRPVLRLIRADKPRLLIADEVGVGKTIEAGLIIKELRARMGISSVLVICPKALVSEKKWANEMKRFDENFTALDGQLLRHCLKETELDGEWPDQYAKAILPFSLFDSELVLGSEGKRRKSGGLLSLDPAPKFDLVIVDEAHHIRNSETFLHQGIRYFCDNAKAVVLMTATPVQLGSRDLYTLLNVLRPDLVIDHASFEQMAAPNQFINDAVKHSRTLAPNWQSAARECLDGVTQTQWGKLFISESPSFQSLYDQLGEDHISDQDRLKITYDIEQLYTFSTLVNRTRRRDIGEFTTRKPETLTVDFTPPQQLLHDNLLALIAKILGLAHGQQNVAFMMSTIRRQAASCLYGMAPLLEDMLLKKIDQLEYLAASDSDADGDLSFVDQVIPDIEVVLAQAENLDGDDPKADAFVKLLQDKQTRDNNKALVFSTFRHTLRYLDGKLKNTNLRVGLVHGSIDDLDRADLRRRFALDRTYDEAIDVLLSSEVGCEGLDFQFCDFLVNYDLPWNPMRIEQRIGRIDRYGQKSETVAIKNFVTPGTVDADIYDRCLWRIGVFHHAVGGSEEILGNVTKELHAIAESFTLTPDERMARLQQLGDNGIRQIQEEQELESRQSELFGLNLPKQTWREEIEAAESFWLSPKAIQACVTLYLEKRLGSDSDHLLGEKPLKSLRLNQAARATLLEDFRKLTKSNEPSSRQWEKWLKGSEAIISVTFDQQIASEDSGALHLTVFHPLVRQASYALETSDAKQCSLIVKSSAVAPGTYQFAIYNWAIHGVKQDSSLVPICRDTAVEATLMDLLTNAESLNPIKELNEAQKAELEALHYGKWLNAQAAHIEENKQLIDLRVQSLTVSHKARCLALDGQIDKATNDKIRIMRSSERARATTDFDAQLDELKRVGQSGDIRVSPVVFGMLIVEGVA